MIELISMNSKAKKHAPVATKTFVLTLKGEKPLKVEFKPEPQKDDPEGTSSRFTAPAGRLPEKPALDKIEITGAIKGKQYHFTEDKD